jgi:chitinase
MESKEFSAMVSEKSTRQSFINHAIKFLRGYGFDGVDIDWEFPADRGGWLIFIYFFPLIFF